MEMTLIGRPLVAGSAEGEALVSNQPLSLWGGVDPQSGEIIDRRHDRAGANVAGRVFVFPHGKGSSTSSATLMESVRNGTAPAAIINMAVDSILALGSIVADEMYGRAMPIVLLPETSFRSIQDGDRIVVGPNGRITVRRETSGGDENG
jgi:predicted aconitase with swiveling domain